MKSKLSLTFIFASIIVAVVFYIASDNYFLAAGIFVVYCFAVFSLLLPSLKSFSKVTARYHECYHFVNNFIIALSIKKSIGAALENTIYSTDKSFQEMTSKLENMDDNQKLRYLQGSYFPFHTYQLFIHIIELYQEEGGDILQMSKYLISDARNTEEYINQVTSIATRKYIEITVLWLISLAILVILRFSLQEFYNIIKNQLFFQISLGGIALFVLLTYVVLFKRGSSIKLKGYDKNEKII